MKRLLLGLLLLFMTACSMQAALETFASPEDQAFARAAIADVATGRTDDLNAKLMPQLRPALGPNLPAMQQLLPHGPLKLVGAHVFANLSQGTKQVNMTWEATHGKRYALISTTLLHAGPVTQLMELRVFPLSRSVEESSRLDLRGKSFAHYLFLVLAVVAFLGCVAGFVLALRTPGLKYRWLWAIGCLVAVGQVSIRWSDGDIFLKIINLQFFGAFALEPGPFAPWQVGFGIPIVTIILLIRRRELLRRQEEQDFIAAGASDDLGGGY
jgi:hypothetical protein